MIWTFLDKSRYLPMLAAASSQNLVVRYGWLVLVRRQTLPLYWFSSYPSRQLVCGSAFYFSWALVLIINKAEHHVLYQYHLVNAANHYMGLIQTETVSNNFIYMYDLIDLRMIFVIVALFPTQAFTSGAFRYRFQVQWSLVLWKKSVGVGIKYHKL